MKKSHVAVLSVVFLVASASAAVNVRDPMNVFGDLKITGGEISAEDQNQNPANITLTSPINMQNNNIYNIGNLNGGTTGGGGLTIPPYNDISNQRQTGTTYTNNHNGPRLVTVITKSGNAGGKADAFVNGNLVASFGSDESASEGFQTLSFFVPQGANYQVDDVQGFLTLEAWYEQDLQGGTSGGGTGTALDWENARSVADRKTSGVGVTAEVLCNPDEILVSAACTEETVDSSNVQYTQPAECDTRTIRRANVAGTYPGVSGTCVPKTSTLKPGTNGGGGSPVFGSVSYTKMGETTEYVAGNSDLGGVNADYDSVKTMSSGDSVSVSRTAQLGGTTKFRVLGGIVNLDTDGPPGGGRHFASALQRDLGYIQLLVDGEVVNEVQNLNEWSDSDRVFNFDDMVSLNREPTITTDLISVEAGDTVTARVVADQEADTDEVGSGCCGKFYQYVVLKRVDK
jgi:hypothetical protein